MSLATALRGCLGGGVVFVDAAGHVAPLTPYTPHLFGVPSAAGHPKDWDSIATHLQEMAAEAARGNRPLLGRQLQVPAGSGPAQAFEVSAFPVQDSGQAAGVVVLLASLDALRQCEERLQRLDRLANLGTLAATMAHEIKNAMVASRTFVDLLLEKNPQAELTDVVRRELARIDAIVARLLKFSGPDRPSLSSVHVHDVLDHILRLLQPQLENRGIRLDRQVTAAFDLVNGDEAELVQAFMNLLLNGLEAMAPDGRLLVKSENVNGDGAAPSHHPAKLRVTIADTGAGIAPENLPHVFEPFFTTKPSGTGLGLAVTKRIIYEHRGTLTVESRPGEGTSFSVVLPCATVE